MITTADTERGLMYGILAAPDDDLPRVAYADWLTENGQPDRGEFIRVQCELARMENASCRLCWAGARDGVCTFGRDALRRRERELWEGFGKPYERSRLFGLPPNWLAFLPSETEGVSAGYAPSDGDAVVERGFVAAVRAPLGVLVGGECPACKGAGKVWVTEPHYHYEGVFPARTRVTCPTCNGQRRTPGVLGVVFGSQPVTRVEVSDREPDADTPLTWDWRREGPEALLTDPDVLPADVFNRLPKPPGHDPRYPVGWDTRDLALSALSDSLVALGRSLAAGWTHGCGWCKGCGKSCQKTVIVREGGPNDVTYHNCDRCKGTGSVPGLPPLKEIKS